MEREIAYTLSDVFVQKIDDCKTVAEIAALHNIMVRDFTKRMQLLQKRHTPCTWLGQSTISPFTCTKSFRPATSQMRSRSTAVIFPHCSGRKPESHFTTISLRKIHAAAQMITTSEMSFSEISQYYSFSSQSHFIQCFRKELGMTPLEYRKRYYRSSEVSEGNTE